MKKIILDVDTGIDDALVETKSELSYGQTICDFNHLWEKEPNVHVCLDVEADRFLDTFIKTLKEAS